MIKSWKDGDIYRWSWTDDEYDKRRLEIQFGTLYWCCSRIGIVKGDYLVDTYWCGVINTSLKNNVKIN